MEKPPILFLHGAFAGPEIWTRFVAPWFAARGHQVAVPRLPGALPGARLRDYVRRAGEAADALDGPPVVVGHSLGGLVAQHLAARRRVAGLALVASPGPYGLAPSLWQLSAGAPDVLAALLLAQSGAAGSSGSRWCGGRSSPRRRRTPGSPRSRRLPMRESPLALLDGLTWDLPAWFMVRRAPVLAVLGDRDAFVPVTDLWAIALAYGAETELIRGAAHGLPIDPHWRSLAWRINAWIDERGLGARGVEKATIPRGIGRHG